ncbi:alpha/beta fold hydrolase [Amycolatopsis sp. CA-230715]|uniref:alpha/beta fold hydrolase n=1 Tax=Amycolatopsis sp. CA-230715 TaxID=2745196 RepID=UPI001C022FA7|nr:alpha/beta hydrolase [Amycolatopsis sp. CA-230715]
MLDLPLVFLHAFPLDSRMWNGIREPLSRRARLITPDQRGLGRTPLPATTREPSLDDAARDLVALLDKLELERVVVGGCSMGGYVALALLRSAPERVGGLVLIDTKASADKPEAAENRHALAKRADEEGIEGWLAGQMLPNLLAGSTLESRPDVTETVRDLIESQPPAGIAWAARAMAARPDSAELLRGADVPALVLVGEHDNLTPHAEASAMAEALSNADLVTIEGAGHLTPLERPDAVSGAILDWLGRAPTR